MAADLPEAERHGEWIGLLKIAPRAWNAVRETTADLLAQAKGGRPQVSALFGPSTYRLTVAVAGRGAVRSSQGGLACPPRCSRLVPSYSPLRLTASPAKGWRFKSWSGACRGTRPACTLPMTAVASARAVFARN